MAGNRSTTTAENAAETGKILRRDGIKRIVLVTHAWHMRRAMLAFRAEGLEIIPAPTGFELPVDEGFWSSINPGVNTLMRSFYALHELVGIAWYELRYGYR